MHSKLFFARLSYQYHPKERGEAIKSTRVHIMVHIIAPSDACYYVLASPVAAVASSAIVPPHPLLSPLPPHQHCNRSKPNKVGQVGQPG